MIGIGLLLATSSLSLAWKGHAGENLTTSRPSPAGGLQPGLWRSEVHIETLDIPELPKALVEKMAKDPNASEARRRCLDQTQALQPPTQMFHRLTSECRYTSWRMSNGTIEGSLSCSPPGGTAGEARVVLTGTYTSKSYALTSTTHALDGKGNLQLHMRAHLTGEREGACP